MQPANKKLKTKKDGLYILHRTLSQRQHLARKFIFELSTATLGTSANVSCAVYIIHPLKL